MRIGGWRKSVTWTPRASRWPAPTSDEAGRVATEFYLDAKGKPQANVAGSATIQWIYDDAGRVIEQWFLWLTGERMSNALGYARMTHAYDDGGNLLEERYFTMIDAPAKIRRWVLVSSPILRRPSSHVGGTILRQGRCADDLRD